MHASIEEKIYYKAILTSFNDTVNEKVFVKKLIDRFYDQDFYESNTFMFDYIK